MSESNIKVGIRLRPLLSIESIADKLPIEIDELRAKIELKKHCFHFDHVFNENSSNKDVYKTLIYEKIKYLFEGFNCTILAYGSTGSGKTFTMGTASKAKDTPNGLIPLAMKDIFDYSNSVAHETDIVIKASFFEIHMENVKDLLKTGILIVPGDPKDSKVSSMTEITVKNYDEAMQVLARGVQTRATGSTAKNEKSSRSHAFFIITLIMTDKRSGISKFSKFQLVDLAGSERTGVDAVGQEFKQGVQINKGLTALGRVISSLSKREKHIPYRDSVLTKYLQDSLGGNSHTVMVTCISPSLTNLEETLSSLRYSNFAKKIKNTVSVNRNSSDVIEHLKSELEKLRRLGNCQEKERLVNEINILNNDLAMANSNFNKISESVLKLSADINSLEDKMVSETFCVPALNNYIEILQPMKKDLNSLIKELGKLITVENGATSAIKLRDIPLPDASLALRDETQQNLDDTEKILANLDDKFVELEMKNYEHLKVLCDYLNAEGKHSLATKKLEDLLRERERLMSSTSFSCLPMDKNKIEDIDEEIKLTQQEAKLCGLAVKKSKIISRCYEYLKRRFEVIKIEKKINDSKEEAKKSKAVSPERNTSGDLWKQLPLEEKILQLERSLEEFDKTDEIEKMNPDEVDCWPNVLRHVINREIRLKILEWESSFIRGEIHEKFPEKENHPNCFMRAGLEERSSACDTKLRLFETRVSALFERIHEDYAKSSVMDFLFEKIVWAEAGPQLVDKYYTSEETFSEFHREFIKFKADLKKIKEEKGDLEELHQKKMLDLNTEWETKTLVLLENATMKIQSEKKCQCQLNMHLLDPLQTPQFLFELWNKRDNIFEQKCQEVDELKEKIRIVELENQKLREAQLRLPNLTAKGKVSRNEKAEDPVDIYLSEDEDEVYEFADSERLDPNYRGTPMYKRNRPKRKSPEDNAILVSPKPPKARSTSGCNCPSDCGTMRCSCKKKKKECSASCRCNKATCLNTNAK